MSKTNFNNYDKAHVDESCRITLSDTDFFSLRSCPSRYMWSPYDIHFQNQGLCWRKELRFPGNICVKAIIFPTHKLYSLFNTISLKHNTLNWYFQCLLNLYLSLFVIIIYRKDESYKVTVHLLVASLSLQICKGGQILTENMSVNIQYILVKFDPIPQRLTCLIDFFFSKEGNSKAKKKILKGPLQHFCQQRKLENHWLQRCYDTSLLKAFTVARGKYWNSNTILEFISQWGERMKMLGYPCLKNVDSTGMSKSKK